MAEKICNCCGKVIPPSDNVLGEYEFPVVCKECGAKYGGKVHSTPYVYGYRLVYNDGVPVDKPGISYIGMTNVLYQFMELGVYKAWKRFEAVITKEFYIEPFAIKGDNTISVGFQGVRKSDGARAKIYCKYDWARSRLFGFTLVDDTVESMHIDRYTLDAKFIKHSKVDIPAGKTFETALFEWRQHKIL